MARRPSFLSPDRRRSRRGVRAAVLAGTAVAACIGASLAFAGFNSAITGGPMSVTSKRIFPGPRVASAWDLRDASSGAEANSSDPLSYADGVVQTPSTAIASGTNRYLEYTNSNSRPGAISVSSMQFNFRLASAGGGNSGNGCFWFDVRSSGSVLATHGSYASPVGCSTGTTQATFSTSIPEVTSTDQANGLVVRVYPWETGGTTRKVNVDMSTVRGATPYVAAFTAYETQAIDNTSGTPSTLAWSLATADSITFTDVTTWPSAAPNTARYLKLSFDPTIPTSAVVTSVTLTNVWRASANVTNSGTLCYYLESFNGTTSLGTHGSGGSAQNCNASGTNNVTDSVSLPEVNTVTKANSLVIKLYYWVSPLCGGGGNPTCVKSVTDQAQVSFNYYLD
jgi:hypothetical protein